MRTVRGPFPIALACALVLATGCRSQRDQGQRSASSASATLVQPDMVLVPAGSFLLGCDPGRDRQCSQDEQPATRTRLDGFQIDRTEVTQVDYRRCVDAARCASPNAGFTPEETPRHAVTHVSWAEAAAYCAWRGARLPSEAEWETAARGSDGRIFPWGDQPATCERADITRCERARSPVGSFPDGKSPYGVLDMAGGVDEWVADEYVSDRSRPGATGHGQRVARGGAHDAWHIRSTARSALDPGHRSADLGFRCAR